MQGKRSNRHIRWMPIEVERLSVKFPCLNANKIMSDLPAYVIESKFRVKRTPL
jgi:hypothetical protein